MLRTFGTLIASLRYLFFFAVLALVLLAVGSLGRGLVELAGLATAGRFAMEPGSGFAIVPYFIRAAFLYFLAVALCSLFVTDLPVPQWMAVRNLFQLRAKVLTFVSIILPLGFMGRMMTADISSPGILYAGAGVFLVLAGIFALVRYSTPSGDEGMSREGNSVPRTQSEAPRGQEGKARDARTGQDRRSDPRQEGRRESEEGAGRRKDDLKFRKETLLDQAVEKELLPGSQDRPESHVTVKPGPRRSRRRR